MDGTNGECQERYGSTGICLFPSSSSSSSCLVPPFTSSYSLQLSPPVLEIGTFVGFSVATWANAVGKDGSVTGLEKSPEFAQMARDQLSRFGWNNAEVVTGDALHT